MKKVAQSFGEILFNSKMTRLVIAIFAIITIWWIFIDPFNPDTLEYQKHLWTSSYLILSVLGGWFGVAISSYWGGRKSVLGRAVLAFSTGLFLQSFGQIIYNYYTLVSKIEAPYPSLGDIGYFGSIFAYIYGVVLLGKLSGLRISIKSFSNKLFALLFPLFCLLLSYLIFLKNYEFDWSSPLTIFLDFGYPLGQAIYLSIAILVLLMSRSFLGGLMRKPIILLLFALVIQYICDFNFLYEASRGKWFAGSWGDYLFAVSYLSMSIALIYMGSVFEKIRMS